MLKRYDPKLTIKKAFCVAAATAATAGSTAAALGVAPWKTALIAVIPALANALVRALLNWLKNR